MDTVIRVKNLTLYYGRHLAVDHIEFEVKAGEIFGFLGPNGAGKTTTQRILTGLLPPTEGNAHVLDHDMAKDPLGAKAHIGVVPEVANPYPELSGWRNLMFTGEIYHLDTRTMKSRAEAALKEFGLWERRHDLARHYSKGMKQRLILAMALLHHPQVLFLDEPTAGLDVESRRMIHQSVKQLTEDGVGVFYTTHYIEEANILCDRVAIISQGRIVASDTPEALKSAFAGSQSVLVSFNVPVDPRTVESLEGVTHVEKQADKLRLFTDSPGPVTTQVVDFARSKNLDILSLNTLGPSLEEVFVSLSKGGFSFEGSPEK
jgi:ABC-2 type transport system ATP-binding protein